MSDFFLLLLKENKRQGKKDKLEGKMKSNFQAFSQNMTRIIPVKSKHIRRSTELSGKETDNDWKIYQSREIVREEYSELLCGNFNRT